MEANDQQALNQWEKWYLNKPEEPIMEWEVEVKIVAYKTIKLTCAHSDIEDMAEEYSYDLCDDDIATVEVNEILEVYPEECDPN